MDSLTVRKIIQLEILHRIDQHHLLQLLHDELLIEYLQCGLLPADFVFKESHVNCIKEFVHL